MCITISCDFGMTKAEQKLSEINILGLSWAVAMRYRYKIVYVSMGKLFFSQGCTAIEHMPPVPATENMAVFFTLQKSLWASKLDLCSET